MNVCIVGAGAIGGLFGARLARSGVNVTAIARGKTAEALRTHGIRLQTREDSFVASVRVAESAAEAGPQDVVIVAVKEPALRSVAPMIAGLLSPSTTVVTAMNGVPWWFFHGIGGAHEGFSLKSVDREGEIARAIPTRHVVGAVLHLAASTPEPGVVRHDIGHRMIIGEPSGGASSRVDAVAAMFRAAGMDVEISPRIQADIWYKLWGNMTMNPVSAITGATLDRILDDPLVNHFCLAVMREAADIGAAIGCPIAQTGIERNAVTRKLGAVRTSMLQDVDAGRPVELDALLSTVREIGTQAGVATPHLDTLFGLARLHARTRGLYPAETRMPS